MGEEVVRKFLHEHDLQVAVGVHEEVEQLANLLCGEVRVVGSNGSVERYDREPLEAGRLRAAVALGLVPVTAAQIEGDELSQ